MKQFKWNKLLFTVLIIGLYAVSMYLINNYIGFKPVDFVMVTLIALIALIAIHVSALTSLVFTFVITLAYGVFAIIGVVEEINVANPNYYYLFIPMSVSVVMSMISILSNHQLSLAVSFEEDYSQLIHVDDVTGFGNVVEFKKNLLEEIERAKRYEHDLALMLIHIESYNDLNHVYGEAQGERFLKYFSSFVQRVTRFTDQQYHIDQGLFALVLPETDHEGALNLKNRFVEEFESLNVIIKSSQKRVNIKIDIQMAAYDNEQSAEAFYNLVKDELVVEPRGENEKDN